MVGLGADAAPSVDDPFANLPAAPRGAPPLRPAIAPAAPGRSPPALAEIDDFQDLPAVPEESGLPVVAAPAQKAPPLRPPGLAPTSPAAPRAPVPPLHAPSPMKRPDAPSLADFDIDLPSVDADLPAVPQAARASAPKANMTFDLDEGGPLVDLPSSRENARRGAADLPVAAPARSPQRPAFGEIDLPSIGGDLPAVARRGADLPVLAAELPTAAPGGGLPVVAGAGLPVHAGGYPEVAGRSDAFRDLPEFATTLPQVANALPVAANALPVVANALPQVADAFPQVQNALPLVANALPATVGTERLLPSRLVEGDDGEFGDLKLTSMPPASLDGAADELDLPPASYDRKDGPRATGGAGFGEVDLGMDAGDAVSTEDMPLPDKVGGGEVALPTAPAGPAGTLRERVSQPRGLSRAAKISLALIGAIAIGGFALQLTPYGAFGYVAVDDTLHDAAWTRLADDAAAKTRLAMRADTFDQTEAALDSEAALHAESPRARALTAYGALAEYEAELRFGRDSARSARAQSWLSELQAAKGPRAAEIHYFTLASAAQAAASGDLAAARAALDLASRKDAADPVQEDVACMRGEIELAARDPAAARAAFGHALDVAPSARAHFGLARAHALSEDGAKARAEIAAALALSSHDAGALVLRAALAWSADRNEAAATSDLHEVLEGASKPAASAGDLSMAHSLLGWIETARGKLSEARASFDAALKLDPRDVDALIGQGEVLYSEGRNTEALARFDTAVQLDPKRVLGIVSDAKAKLVLERLADAKAQLTAARATFPGDVRVPYWLAKVETALGNKKAAEDAYTVAIGLADATKLDPIQPYLGLAEMLAGAGRATEAQAKLDEARGKLPDSAAMERALGEVAAVQGNYDDAVIHYQLAVQKDPEDPTGHFLLGQTYRRMQRVDLASMELEKVFNADKDYPGLAMERGSLYEQSGQIEKALEQFSAALQKAPNDVDLQLRVGAAYVGGGHAEQALAILKKVMDKRPQSADANFYYGRAFFLKGGSSLTDATRYLKKAVQLDPNHAEYHFYLAWVATEASNPDLTTAKTEVEQALTIDRLMGDAYWQRGVVELLSGLVDDALKDLHRALQLKPTRFEAHATLADCYDRKNEPREAEAEWAKAIARDDQRPIWRYKFGRLLFDQGNLAAALPHLAFAVNAAEKESPQPGWTAKAEFMAAEAYRRAGQTAQAIDHYNHFLDIAPPTSPDRKDALSALAGLGHARDH
jgi:tetratricopeptide (TPR) repeat protein